MPVTVHNHAQSSYSCRGETGDFKIHLFITIMTMECNVSG